MNSSAPINSSFSHVQQHIWAAAYIDGKTECIEIRTADFPDEVITVLWHYDGPLGSSIADFLYADDDKMAADAEYIEMICEEFNRAPHSMADYSELLYKIWQIMDRWLKQSAIFAILGVSIGRACNASEEKSRFHYYDITEAFDYLRELRGVLFNITDTCLQGNGDLMSKYMSLQHTRSKSMYPSLEHGRLRLETVERDRIAVYPFELPGYTYSHSEVKRSAEPGEEIAALVLNAEYQEDVPYFLLAACLQADVRFRVCKYCGRYFSLTNNYATEYCDRLIEGSTKTCKEIGSLRLYEQRKFDDPIIKEYKRSYKAHNARIRYGLMTREEFSAWSAEARRKRDECIAGRIPFEDFVAWLDSDRLD